MPTPLITALIERMPAVSFVQFYGMIEHLCLTVLGAADQLRKIGRSVTRWWGPSCIS
jgi:hypothetical protein